MSNEPPARRRIGVSAYRRIGVGLPHLPLPIYRNKTSPREDADTPTRRHADTPTHSPFYRAACFPGAGRSWPRSLLKLCNSNWVTASSVEKTFTPVFAADSKLCTRLFR